MTLPVFVGGMDDKALLEQLAECERERQRQSLAAPHYHPIPGGLLECKCGDELTRPREENEGLRADLETAEPKKSQAVKTLITRVKQLEIGHDEWRTLARRVAAEVEQFSKWADGLVTGTQRLQGVEQENERLRDQIENLLHRATTAEAEIEWLRGLIE